jgi:hypothetical protein
MIIADTDILSALAKVKRLPLLFALFQTDVLEEKGAILTRCLPFLSRD